MLQEHTIIPKAFYKWASFPKWLVSLILARGLQQAANGSHKKPPATATNVFLQHNPNHPSHALLHNTFNGLPSRWIPLAESWPPNFCTNLTFILHQIWWLCVTSSLCALYSFFFRWNMFYYYPERPPSPAHVYFWILSSPCKANDLDPSQS